jgi:hypothetical protein
VRAQPRRIGKRTVISHNAGGRRDGPMELHIGHGQRETQHAETRDHQQDRKVNRHERGMRVAAHPEAVVPGLFRSHRSPRLSYRMHGSDSHAC